MKTHGAVSGFDILIIDGANLLFRVLDAHAGLSIIDLTGDDEVQTGGVYGFLSSLGSLKRHYRPNKIVVAWEGTDNFRYQLFPEYKANRRNENLTPADIEFRKVLSDQRVRLRSILCALGVDQYRGRECEADDVIGALVVRHEQLWNKIAIYSNDSDLRQLVSEYTTVIAPPVHGIKDMIFNPQAVRDRYGISEPAQVADIKALAGDTSDNIPGLDGIGEKTAAKLVKAYGDVYDVLVEANTGDKKDWPVAERFVKTILDNAQNISTYKQLATIKTDVKLIVTRGKHSPKRVEKELKRYAFRSLLDKETFAVLASIGG